MTKRLKLLTIILVMKKLTALLSAVLLYFGLVSPASAQAIATCPTSGSWAALCGITFGGGLFQWVITVVFIGASLLCLAFLVFGGIKWITSGGDKGGVEAARNMIVAALVGLVITFLAYFIIQIVFTFFGLGSFSSGFTIPVIPH